MRLKFFKKVNAVRNDSLSNMAPLNDESGNFNPMMEHIKFKLLSSFKIAESWEIKYYLLDY
jgi:hypothetical protein